METKEIEIGKVIRDDQYYPRLRTNWLTIYNYRQALQMGSIFPPIDVAENNNLYILIDGAHRLEAFKGEKRETILANLLDIPEDQYYIESVKRNIANSLPFSPIEKRQIIVNLRKSGLQDNVIAEIIKMPPLRMEKFLSGCLVKGDFRDVVIKSPLRGMINRYNLDNDIEVQQRVFNAVSQVQLLDQFIQLLENKWIDYKNEQVQIRMVKIKNLLRDLL